MIRLPPRSTRSESVPTRLSSDDDAVAPGHAMRLHRAGEFGDTVAQFQRGEAAHRAGDRRIIDQGNAVAMPGGDMAVERVVAGIGLGAAEPAVEGWLGRIHPLLPRLVPM